MGPAQHGELEVECIYFCRLGIFFVLSFLFIFVCCCGAYIGNFIIFSGLGGFPMGDYMLLTWVVCIRGIFISGSVIFYLGLCNNWRGRSLLLVFVGCFYRMSKGDNLQKQNNSYEMMSNLTSHGDNNNRKTKTKKLLRTRHWVSVHRKMKKNKTKSNGVRVHHFKEQEGESSPSKKKEREKKRKKWGESSP